MLAAPDVFGGRRRIDRSGYLFVAFFTIPFLLFNIAPIFFGIYLSFTEWGIIGAPTWVGLANFREALADDWVANAFLNTLRYALIIVPGVTMLGLLFALFVHQRWPLATLARTLFFTPNVVSATVIGMVWVWLLDTQFHRGDMAADRRALRLEAGALALVDQAGADHLGEVVAVLGADQLEHQVERRNAAGAGQAAAVAEEQLLDHLDLGMALVKELHRLPVQRDPVAVEQPGGGEGEGAGVDRTQERAVPVEPPQPGEQTAAQMLGRLVAGDDEHGRAELHLGDATIGHDLGAAAGPDGTAVGREQPGREQAPPGVLVRHAQRLDRQNQGVDREFGQEEKSDLLGRRALGHVVHDHERAARGQAGS